jgi:hypothetical protein
VIEGNHITGPLACGGDTPALADEGGSDIVSGARAGQCTAPTI